jgi:hypothetical protein
MAHASILQREPPVPGQMMTKAEIDCDISCEKLGPVFNTDPSARQNQILDACSEAKIMLSIFSMIL